MFHKMHSIKMTIEKFSYQKIDYWERLSDLNDVSTELFADYSYGVNKLGSDTKSKSSPMNVEGNRSYFSMDSILHSLETNIKDFTVYEKF